MRKDHHQESEKANVCAKPVTHAAIIKYYLTVSVLMPSCKWSCARSCDNITWGCVPPQPH
jgi:hypothetical protein